VKIAKSVSTKGVKCLRETLNGGKPNRACRWKQRRSTNEHHWDSRREAVERSIKTRVEHDMTQRATNSEAKAFKVAPSTSSKQGQASKWCHSQPNGMLARPASDVTLNQRELMNRTEVCRMGEEFTEPTSRLLTDWLWYVLLCCAYTDTFRKL